MGLWDWIIGSPSNAQRPAWDRKDWDAYREANYNADDWERYRARVRKVKAAERAARKADAARGLERRR